MPRLPPAGGLAFVLALLTLVLAASAAASPTIKTLAGGGTQTPIYYDQPGEVKGPDANLPAPVGIAWSGDPSGIFYVVPTGTRVGASSPQCVMEWYQPDAGKDTGFLGMWGGAYEDCDAAPGGYYPSYSTTFLAKNVKLENPCCVASNQHWDAEQDDPAVGPYVVDPGTGHVDFFRWPDNYGFSVAGATQHPDCGTGTPPAPPDSDPDRVTGGNPDPLYIDPEDAQFCTLTGIAVHNSPRYDWLISETGRDTKDRIYQVLEPYNGSPTERYIELRYETLTTGAKVNAVAWADDGFLLPVWAESTSDVYFLNVGNTRINVAGIGGAGFSGDGGNAAAAALNNPKGIALGFDGQVYIADTNNCRIRRVTSIVSGTISTLAGNGCSGSAAAPYGDGGPASDANLDHPAGVSMSSAGLLVSDTGHNRVRLIDRTTITAGPAVTTDTTPSFTVESLDSPAHLKCEVNDGGAFDCTSPVTLSSVPQGSHKLEVWENGDSTDTDSPHPPDPTPAVANFTVDTSAPTGLSLREPAAGATGVPADVTFSWNAGQDAPAGIDHHELLIDGQFNLSVPTSACSAGVCSAQAAAPLSETTHNWQVRAVDKAGNSASSETRDVTVGGAPAALFLISPNPALVGRAVTFDASATTDESGIARYEWDLDGDGAFETDGGASPTTSRTYTAPASVNISLRVTDGTQKTGTATQALRITELSGQSLLGISVNSGAQYTKDTKVKLLVKFPANTNSIVVSNDGGFLAPQTFPIAASIPWVLDSSGPERLPKTVYARFMLGPIISQTYTDDIILDETPPKVQQATIAPLAGRAAAAVTSAAKARPWRVKVKATDSNSGVSGLQVTANKRKPGKTLRYRRKLTVKSATRPKFLRARDRAGNLSRWKKLR